MKFFLVGPGRVGVSLSSLLVASGHELLGCWSRSPEGLERLKRHLDLLACTGEIPEIIGEADFILVTTSESALDEIAEKLTGSGLLREGQIIFHVSGAYPSSVLMRKESPMISTGSIHPIQSIPSVESGLKLLPHSAFTVEGDEKAVRLGKKLVEDIGARAFHVASTSRPLYHCALSMASNLMVLIAWLSFRMMLQAGIEYELARDFVLSIMEGTLSNLKQMELEGALTGPVVRGDWQTVQKHLKTLEAGFPEVSDLYRVANALLVEIAKKRGEAPEEGLRKIEDLFRGEDVK
ncbi:MAG: Rossmann-like and DUF2520 domain-containing protein [Candidatus Glassbacteria bacterium]